MKFNMEYNLLFMFAHMKQTHVLIIFLLMHSICYVMFLCICNEIIFAAVDFTFDAASNYISYNGVLSSLSLVESSTPI